jgi:small-conductance mechanosensitive channel
VHCILKNRPLGLSVTGIKPNGVEVQVTCWAKNEDFAPMRSSLQRALKERFDERQIAFAIA